jgi:hypothetical protein
VVIKHNGIAPSTDGERTTPFEAPQHRLYYCALTSTSFLASRVKLTNILPLKTSLVVHQRKSAGCGLGKVESLLIPLALTLTFFQPKASLSALNF